MTILLQITISTKIICESAGQVLVLHPYALVSIKYSNKSSKEVSCVHRQM